MKRQLSSTSSVDEPRRNVRSRNLFTPSMPRERVVSLDQPHVNFQLGVQFMAPNLHADHQSPTPVSGVSISRSSDIPQGLPALAGSTPSRVCVQCRGLLSAQDERGNYSLSSEVPPPASDPLVPSIAPDLRSRIPASEDRSVSLRSTSPIDGPQRNVRTHYPFAHNLDVAPAWGPVILSSEAPPASSHSLVPSTAPHLSEQYQNRTFQSPYCSAPGLRPNHDSQTSYNSLYQNYRIIQSVRHRNMHMDINCWRNEVLLPLEERIGKVNTGIKTSELSKFVKKIICHGEQDEAELCAICLEQYVDADAKGQLKCGHEYHFSCIGKWMEEKVVCPICRQRATLSLSNNYVDAYFSFILFVS